MADGRLPVDKLCTAYDRLGHGWKRHVIYKEKQFPILSYVTTCEGPALWVLAGIHGEEPAGPNAIAQAIDVFMTLGKDIPIVLFPLCNPTGYALDWRYPDEPRDHTKGHSVGDAEHVLVEDHRPRQATPASPQAAALLTRACALLTTHPPVLAIDLHEDELVEKNHYIYSQGPKGAADPIARKVVSLFVTHRIPLELSGMTRFGESVHNGIVLAMKDGSIDEFLGADKFYYDGNVREKRAATAIVIETPTNHGKKPLDERIKVHQLVLQSLRTLWHSKETK